MSKLHRCQEPPNVSLKTGATVDILNVNFPVNFETGAKSRTRNAGAKGRVIFFRVSCLCSGETTKKFNVVLHFTDQRRAHLNS